MKDFNIDTGILQVYRNQLPVQVTLWVFNKNGRLPNLKLKQLNVLTVIKRD